MAGSLARVGERVDPAERLLDLVIALTHAQHRMTKSQIRAQVNGYGAAASTESFERMFERDKDALRELGIPLVTDTDATHADDVGYRIDTGGYALPPVSLTPAEVGVLSLAAQLWQDASMRGPASRGLTKLRAVGPAPEPDAGAGIALRVRAPEAAFSALLAAVTDRRAVAFTYRAASTGQVRRRVVEPWRLICQDRGWYVVGLDRDRRAPRAFRLSRIEGRVVPTGPAGAVAVPAAVDATDLLATALGTGGTARLALLPERGAALRARAVGPATADGARDVVAVPFEDVEPFAEELAGYADAVVVLDPPELREAVRRRLTAAAGLVGTAQGGA